MMSKEARLPKQPENPEMVERRCAVCGFLGQHDVIVGGGEGELACLTCGQHWAPLTPKKPRARRARETAPAYVPFSRSIPGPSRAGRRLGDAAAVFEATADIREALQEIFICFDLDVRHRIIQRRTVAIGTLTGVEAHPREVFRGAIVNSAAAVILAHNHPSGDCSPSRMDLELTKRMREVGEICGITVLDHVVVGLEGYHSMAERGWWR